MPRLSTWYLRASLVYLLLGFSLGALLLAHKGVPIHPALWSGLPAHIEFLLFGFVIQLILGMAYWILPRFGSGPSRRGNVTLAWAAFWLLNLGLWMVAVAPWLGGLDWAAALGRGLETAGAAAFALHAWPRIKGFRA